MDLMALVETPESCEICWDAKPEDAMVESEGYARGFHEPKKCSVILVVTGISQQTIYEK